MHFGDAITRMRQFSSLFVDNHTCYIILQNLAKKFNASEDLGNLAKKFQCQFWCMREIYIQNEWEILHVCALNYVPRVPTQLGT